MKEKGWTYPVESEVEIYWSITPWDKEYPQYKDYYDSRPYYSSFNKKLPGRKYWSVYYHPKDRTAKGGSLVCFIDAVTGEVIDIFAGA